jgi:hypothetical protein
MEFIDYNNTTRRARHDEQGRIRVRKSVATAEEKAVNSGDDMRNAWIDSKRLDGPLVRVGGDWLC